MVMYAVDYLSKYWLIIVLCFTVLSCLALIGLLIYRQFFQKEKSFKDNLIAAKQVQIAICIDMEEKKVEKYYLYDQNNKDEIISLDEFLVHFDKMNVEKLKNWLSNITRMTDFSKTRRNELVMYNNNNDRRVYLVELERYDAENKRYHLNFKDMTDSINIFRRAGKIAAYSENEDFFNKANERLSVSDSDANNYLVAIKFKEHSFAKKELQYDTLRLVEESVFNKINYNKYDSDLVCLTSNGTFLLFSANVANIKKYKKNIKRILLECSGEYHLIANKFSYAVTLVAGYTKIEKNEQISADKILEAEAAADSLISRGRFADRLQLFDEHLRNAHDIHNNKLLAVEKVISENLFNISYEPIIKTKTKTVSGYNVIINIPHSLKMDFSEFIDYAKQRSYRLTFFTKIFEAIRKHPDCNKKNFYLSFDFDNLNRVMEAYQSNENNKSIKVIFCLEFSNITLQNVDLITIEKALTTFKETNKVRFGITYNTLSTLYLNDKIYSKIDVVLFAGQLIEKSLDSYSYSSLLDIYRQIAITYNHDVIGLNVKSLAIYELFTNYNVNKVSGSYLTPHIENERIADKSLLKSLLEIENRKY